MSFHTIFIIVLLFLVTRNENCHAMNLKVISDSSFLTAFVKKDKSKPTSIYEIKIINLKETTKINIIKFESFFNFTKVYCSDRFIVLTNPNTSEKAVMCIFDIVNKDLIACEALFDLKQDYISTHTKSKLTTTENGCYIETMYNWHNDDWEISKDSILLRLGDAIPNKCTIYWIYNTKTKLFSIYNCKKNTKNSNHYNIKQYRMKKCLYK